MKKWVYFFGGVMTTALILWLIPAIRGYDTWEQKVRTNKVKGVVFILHNPDAESTYEAYEAESRFGDTKVVIYRHGADAQDAINRVKNQVQP